MTSRSTTLHVKGFPLLWIPSRAVGACPGKKSIRTRLWSTLKTCFDNPERILNKLCELTGLPYHDSLLHWDASTDVIKNWKAVGDNLVYRAMYNQGITSTRVFAIEGTDGRGSTHWWCDSAGWCFYDMLQWHEQTQNGLKFSENMNTVLISKLLIQEHSIDTDSIDE